jgi:hypothetical protein
VGVIEVGCSAVVAGEATVGAAVLTVPVCVVEDALPPQASAIETSAGTITRSRPILTEFIVLYPLTSLTDDEL